MLLLRGGFINKNEKQLKATLIRYLARDGYSLPQIAQILNIDEKTVKRYEKQQAGPGISYEKMLTDYEVENALLRRALGYKYEETKTSSKPNGEEIVVTEKEIAPDVSAALAWLKIKRSDVWSTSQEQDESLKKLAEVMEDITKSAKEKELSSESE